MAQHEEHDELTSEELDAQTAEPLPDREAMSIVPLGGPDPIVVDTDLPPPPLAD